VTVGKTWNGGIKGKPNVKVPLGPVITAVSGTEVDSGTAVAAIDSPALEDGVFSLMAGAAVVA
jgi:hypothetical protein